MKDMFPEFYRPTEEEFSEIWKECIFALDANVLLNLYRYSDSTANSLLNLFKALEDRIWLPHQAALEFQKNRCAVISTQMRYYDEVVALLSKDMEELSRKLEQDYGRHRFLKIKDYTGRLRRWCRRVEREILSKREKYGIPFEDDPIRDSIDQLFEGKVGAPSTDEDLDKISAEGKKRYADNVPPGFADSDKNGKEKYGDLVIWFQIIDKDTAEKKPFILVTDERKEDWWQIIHGKTVGPRSELIAEFLKKSEQKFYMYNQEQFMKYAPEHIRAAKETIKDEAVEEVKEVRESSTSASISIADLSRKGQSVLEPMEHKSQFARVRSELEQRLAKVASFNEWLMTEEALLPRSGYARVLGQILEIPSAAEMHDENKTSKESEESSDHDA